MKHELKTWPEYFKPLSEGTKTFEFRRDDREGGFHEGDELVLREYEPSMGYTGKAVNCRVGYILRHDRFAAMAVNEGWVIMSVMDVSEVYDFEEAA